VIVKRITIEGEHTYLLTLKPPTSSSSGTLDLHPVFNLPHGSPLSVQLPHIKWVLPYQYMFQPKGIRLVTHACEEYLLVFKDQAHAEKVRMLIREVEKGLEAREALVMDVKRYQQCWLTGMISNAEYLLYLNFVGNRSFNDLTQYPVFPWVVADYKNANIDFDKGGQFVYRDLSRPIGALNQDKLDQFRSKYFEILNKATTPSHHLHTTLPQSNVTGGIDSSLEEKPYMYLSHYSTPGIVLYYLIRQLPSYLLTI